MFRIHICPQPGSHHLGTWGSARFLCGGQMRSIWGFPGGLCLAGLFSSAVGEQCGLSTSLAAATVCCETLFMRTGLAGFGPCAESS